MHLGILPGARLSSKKKHICKVPNTRYVQCKLTVSVVMLSKRLSRLMGCSRAVLFIYLGSLTLEHFETSSGKDSLNGCGCHSLVVTINRAAVRQQVLLTGFSWSSYTLS